MKKWIKGILAVLVVSIIGVIAYIEINKEKLIALVVDEINQTIDGTITYDGSNVSLLSSFPNIGLTLNDVILHDALMQEDIPVAQIGTFTIEVDFFSAIRKDLNVNAFNIESGKIYLAEYNDGGNNYSLVREQTSTSSSTNAINFKINDFRLLDIDLIYVDEKSNSRYEVVDFNNQGKLIYKDEVIYAENDFDGEVILELASILPFYRLDLDGDMKNTINSSFDKVELERGSILVNDLPVLLSGTVNMQDGARYAFDFSSPSTEIKRIVSLLPNFYKNKYQDLISKGSFVLSGDVSGNTENDFPLFKVSLLAQDGSLSYPSHNAQIDKLGFSLIAENTTPHTAYTKVIVNDMDLLSGSSSLKGDFTSISDNGQHKVTMDMDADMNLADIARSLELEEGTELDGIVKGVIKGNGRLDLKTQEIIPTDKRLNIDLTLDQVKYKDASNHVFVENTIINGDESKLTFETKGLDYNRSIAMDAKGHIEQPLVTMMVSDSEVQGGVDINASLLDLNQLTGTKDTMNSVTGLMEIPNVNFNYSFEADKIIQSTYEFNGIRASGNLQNENTTIDFSVDEFNGSTLNGNGSLENILDYGLNGAIMGGHLTIVSDRLDLNQFMGATTDDTQDLTTNDLIPDNINLDIDYESGAIQFKDIDIAKSLGKVSIKDKKVIIESKGDIFGGKIGMVGTFDNNKEEGYHVDFQLDLKGMQFAATAAKLKLFKQLIPIAHLLDGEYTSTLNWNSDLDNNYMPDLNSLSAYGLIETKNSGLTSQLPIDSLIHKLNILDTKSSKLKIEDAREHFIVENGHVLLKNMTMRLGDSRVKMSGSHSFAQDLNYKLKIEVPKSQLKIDGLLAAVQNKLKFSKILKSATDDVKVQVEALMTGTILKPQFKITGVNLKRGSVVESIQDEIVSSITVIKDSIVTEIQDTIGSVVAHGEAIVDSAKTVLNEAVDSVRAVVTSTVDSVETVVAETIDTAKIIAAEQADELKDTLMQEGEGMLGDILAGNKDSIDFNIDDIFKGKQNELDSLSKKFPINLFGAKKKKK